MSGLSVTNLTVVSGVLTSSWYCPGLSVVRTSRSRYCAVVDSIVLFLLLFSTGCNSKPDIGCNQNTKVNTYLQKSTFDVVLAQLN